MKCVLPLVRKWSHLAGKRLNSRWWMQSAMPLPAKTFRLRNDWSGWIPLDLVSVQNESRRSAVDHLIGDLSQLVRRGAGRRIHQLELKMRSDLVRKRRLILYSVLIRIAPRMGSVPVVSVVVLAVLPVTAGWDVRRCLHTVQHITLIQQRVVDTGGHWYVHCIARLPDCRLLNRNGRRCARCSRSDRCGLLHLLPLLNFAPLSLGIHQFVRGSLTISSPTLPNLC